MNRTASSLFVMLALARTVSPVQSAPGIRSSIQIEGAEVRVCWQSNSNLIYQVQYKPALGTSAWTDLGPPLTASGGSCCATNALVGPKGVYRVLGPDMIWIPSGTFIMGSPDNEYFRDSWEGPQTEVTLSRSFLMSRFEVTQGEYLEVMGVNPSTWRNGATPLFGGTGGPVTNETHLPVDYVNWFDATNYCAKLTARERIAGRLPAGWAYRLPTEAEWEYACRAGTTTVFHERNDLRSGMENFDGRSEYDSSIGTINNPDGTFLGRPVEVGSYESNAWGIYDMHGNVGEWCADWMNFSGLPGGSVIDPQGPATGNNKVLRGGGWGFQGKNCRSAYRNYFWPQSGNSRGIGIRVVLGQPYPPQ